MAICKEQQIHNFCHPNAIMTLKEYLEDYASPETKKVGEELIKRELETLQNKKVECIVEENLAKIENGERDFRF
jgi:2-iminoacetate synthase